MSGGIRSAVTLVARCPRGVVRAGSWAANSATYAWRGCLAWRSESRYRLRSQMLRWFLACSLLAWPRTRLHQLATVIGNRPTAGDTREPLTLCDGDNASLVDVQRADPDGRQHCSWRTRR